VVSSDQHSLHESVNTAKASKDWIRQNSKGHRKIDRSPQVVAQANNPIRMEIAVIVACHFDGCQKIPDRRIETSKVKIGQRLDDISIN
jgi:hypothetical protein